MNLKIFTVFLFFCLSLSTVFPQTKEKDTLFIATWNLENLFDTVHDPGKKDEEFTPESIKEWTPQRLNVKLHNLASIIKMMNNGKGPDILGVTEVEHRALLDSMIAKYLPDKNYDVAYMESPDNRGIDNGIIYNSKKLKLINVIGDTVRLSANFPTRLILDANFEYGKDTIRVFENHWPSRIGGAERSQINRIEAAELLKSLVDRYYSLNHSTDIVIMGDFNDMPGNISIKDTLGADSTICTPDENKSKHILFNLAYKDFSEGLGTYKYRDEWDMLDQIIISKNMVEGKHIKYLCGSFEIFKPEIMITKSGKYEGTPFPTYGGNHYLGGYSDHFPVVAKFIIN
jgi:predicted extracellular nuclease